MKKVTLPFIVFIIVFSCSPRVDFDVKVLPITGLEDTISVVCAGDLTGNSLDELILGKDSTVIIYRINGSDSAELIHSSILKDQVLLMKTGDVDNDGINELVAVTGQKRYRETDVRVYLIYQTNEEWQCRELYSKHSLRPQATDLIIASYPDPEKPSIIVSYFESKYMVETVSITKNDENWSSEIIEVKRMAMARDVGEWKDDLAGKTSIEMAVGRVYGDEIGMTGDAYFFGEESRLIPSKRGVKTVRFGDGDNDGENEIYLGDGWHQDYGKIARGRIAQVDKRNSDITYELIEDVKYQYETTQIEIGDINQDGLNEVITRGNRFIRIYKKENGEWKVYSDSIMPAKQFTTGNITGNKHPEIIFSGSEVIVLNLGNLEFSSELGQEIKTEPVSPDSLIGKPAPELSMMKWMNGSFPGLYNSKGKVILLDFWATWCKPCIKTFPEMKRFQETYGPDGLQILGLTRIDNRQDIEDIQEFVDKQGFVYPIGIGNESLNNLVYGVGAIPHVVLIDKKGVVRWWKIGAGDTREMEEMIVQLVAE